ncbi:hypothetical protein ACKXGF_11680 [Alkalibacillus sp. S2W]|uniref:hypothetical protein n=1 Tax=Alkalibacillus sp. S2W TaxID=3386553 RepID=UPI00398D1424
MFNIINFVHIGMMKSATTYVQGVWHKDNNYNLIHQEIADLVYEIRNIVVNDSEDKKVESSINRPRSIKGSIDVLSFESLSTAFLNNMSQQFKIPNYIRLISRELNRNIETENILLTIREPISWIKSIYIQSIKQGNTGSAQEFINKQENFIKHSLDLRMLVENYSKYFNNMLILPLEILKQDEDLFWNVISDAFDLPPMQTRINEKLNTSLDLDRTYILSKMNGFSKLMMSTLSQANHFQSLKEKQHLINAHNQNEKWVHRRFVENATDEEVEQMYSFFGEQRTNEDFFSFDLTERLKESIQKNYIDYLRENTIPEIADDYQHKFDEFLSKK